MALVLRIFKKGANTQDAQNILAEGPQQQAIDTFINSLKPGTTVSAGEYVALNHDTTGEYTDSIEVDFPAFATKYQAQAPVGIDNDVKSDNVVNTGSLLQPSAPSSASVAPAQSAQPAQSSQSTQSSGILAK